MRAAQPARIANKRSPPAFAPSDFLGGVVITASGPLVCRATIVALNRSRINVSLRFFIIPLLVFGFPYLSLAALAASKRLVEIKFSEAPVCVDVRKLAVIGWNSRRMILLLNWAKTQNSLSFAQLLLAGIPSGQCVVAHVRSPPNYKT